MTSLLKSIPLRGVLLAALLATVIAVLALSTSADAASKYTYKQTVHWTNTNYASVTWTVVTNGPMRIIACTQVSPRYDDKKRPLLRSWCKWSGDTVYRFAQYKGGKAFQWGERIIVKRNGKVAVAAG